jgi:hypothetical protein
LAGSSTNSAIRSIGTTEQELFRDLGYGGGSAAVTGEALTGAHGGGSAQVVRGGIVS